MNEIYLDYNASTAGCQARCSCATHGTLKRHCGEGSDTEPFAELD